MVSFLKKSVVYLLFLMFISSAYAPLLAKENAGSNLDSQKELALLRGEHYLYVQASDDVGQFHIFFSFPPDYQYQVPIYLGIFNDTTADVLHYQIENDANEPNKLINFTIGPMEEDERVLIHFTFWVLVENHDYSDLPDSVEFPDISDLPEETKIWLSATEVAQKDSFIIRLKARQLRGLSDNVVRFAGRIAPFIKWHRYPSFVLQLNLALFMSQDAITTLFIGGENVGRSHLGCALLRSQNIPARVLLAHNDQGFWTQMHYMFEYYLPDYGWVLIDSTKGETPYDTKRQIINRVCYPEDENDTKDDYIIPFMKGEERWLWIDNDNVEPWYVDCNEGSKSQMFIEGGDFATSQTVDDTMTLTRTVLPLYQTYLGQNLTGPNLLHFQNATGYQEDALQELQDSDIEGYIDAMNFSYQEYMSITP